MHFETMVSELAPLKMKILDLSEVSSTCAEPGPWQASHPCLAAPPRVSPLVAKWGEFSQAVYSASWQALQVSEPTNFAVELEVSCAAGDGFDCWGAACAAAMPADPARRSAAKPAANASVLALCTLFMGSLAIRSCGFKFVIANQEGGKT